ncbi:bifunctional folylpolyglutamate synthase/dihydrofolate synthase [Balneola vulgaris]|uniref:bifunctional folylpolyglutamate synthase/dihydrofolate synthase n=1 Tax=Balneola vulgaris TaxID=287535 RepID=UPI0003784CE4|nr:Mur ligase family protein [Balneola vulgaris]
MEGFRNIENVWTYLEAIPKFQDKGASAANFALENISTFCEAIGNPQDNFPTIHVAGTNGKGTTCHLFEEVYRHAGYKTGLFTSPHLIHYNERVRINGRPIDDELILAFFQETEEVLVNTLLTFFEISTALAFWVFSKLKVDIAIIETGLGGRLDSTNIITPKLSVITSVALDHIEILGDTEEKIAFEKAGIIKQDVPVVVGKVSNSVQSVIQEVALKKNAPIHCIDLTKVHFDKGEICYKDSTLVLQTNFIESVNAYNVEVCLQGVKLLQNSFPVEVTTAHEAIVNFKGAPGRFEQLLPHKQWYFSGAHNVEALESSLRVIEDEFQQEATLVLSLMKDKVHEQSLSQLRKHKNLFYYQQKVDRAASYEQVNDLLPVKKIDDSTAESILNELDTSLVIFIGSFYFYPIVKRWINTIADPTDSFLT